MGLRETDPTRPVEFVIAQGAMAKGDEPLLRIVLQNLMNNAWKFTRNRERARIEFGMSENGKKSFFVRDNGAGFDMRYANKLFGTFRRLHSEAEFEGTGIGLATIQRIIRRHDGQVWAEGDVGRGYVQFLSACSRGLGKQIDAFFAESPFRPDGNLNIDIREKTTTREFAVMTGMDRMATP